MSMEDRAVAAMLAQLAMAADGALLGLGAVYMAYCSLRKYAATSSALRKIHQAPVVEPSDLRSILPGGDDSGGHASSSSSDFDCGKLVIVRGSVEVKSAVGIGNWKTNLVTSPESGGKGVILERVHTCIYKELKGIFQWPADICSLFSPSWKQRGSSSIRMVPFILVEEGKGPQSDYVVVNMEGSRHPLPLTTVYQDFQPVNASPFTFLQALLGLEYPVGLLYEEKILPLRKNITAVGICNLKNGIPEIKSCKDLPYFLSDLNKAQIIADISFRSNVLMWSGLIFGSLSIGIIGYSIARHWFRWKERRRPTDTSTDTTTPAEVVLDEESGEVPDGELCAVCLLSRRRSAFIPCGHLVCCQRCALTVEREASPKCPLCRQTIRGSVRIYDS